MVQKDRKESGLLPIDFSPTEDHVVIKKGTKYCNHIGNLRLRCLVQSKLSEYIAAQNNKHAKSLVLADVIQLVRMHSSCGGFVRQDSATGRWYKADEYMAREKTSQAFRDALRERYKSSRVNKRKQKPEKKETEEEVSILSMTSNAHFKKSFEEMAFNGGQTSLASLIAPYPSSALSSNGASTPAGVNIPQQACSGIRNRVKEMMAGEKSDSKGNNSDLLSKLFSSISREINTDDVDPFEPLPLRENQPSSFLFPTMKTTTASIYPNSFVIASLQTAL